MKNYEILQNDRHNNKSEMCARKRQNAGCSPVGVLKVASGKATGIVKRTESSGCVYINSFVEAFFLWQNICLKGNE